MDRSHLTDVVVFGCMGNVLLRRVFTGLVMVGLAVGAAAQMATTLMEPAAPLLPQSFGQWRHADADARGPYAFSLSTVSKDALEECGPQRSQIAGYQSMDGFVRVEAIQFGDRSGAYSAFTIAKRSDMRSGHEIGSFAAIGDDVVLFQLGTTLVLAQPVKTGPKGTKDEAEISDLKALAAVLPKTVGNQGVAPLLPSLLPVQGLVDGSVRYALGAASYSAEGGVLPAAALAWDKSAEAVTAQYKDKRGEETLTMLLYPTPEIAGAAARTVQSLVNAAGAPYANARVRREGELVMLASGTFAPDEAQHMIENTHLKQQLSVDNDMAPSTHFQILQTYSLLANIAILAGVLMLAAVLLGLFLGGGRAAYRVMRGKPAASEPEFLSLHLDPQNKAPQFGKSGD